MRAIVPAIAALAVTLLAACGGAAPATGSRQADREACGEAAVASVEKADSKRFLSWVAGPVTRWTRIDRSESACMTGKGWAVTRACSDDELRQARSGGATPVVVVTAAGIRCRDPGRAS